MPSSRSWRATSALLLLSACAHPPPPPRDLAVAPAAVVGLPMAQGTALRQALEEETRAREQLELVAPAELDGALVEAPAECAAETACLADVAHRVGADLVLAVSLAGLGDTYLVRSQLVDVAGALVLQDVQETVVGGPEQVEAYAGTLVERLFPADPEPPWYRRWWFWTIIAGAVGAAAGTTALAVALQQGPPADAVRLGEL